jgi:hypothetical protein
MNWHLLVNERQRPYFKGQRDQINAVRLAFSSLRWHQIDEYAWLSA